MTEVSRLLDRPIAFHPIFAEMTGDVLAGLMLSQAVYWSTRTNDPEGWFYKTQKEWQKETCLSRSNQDTARRILRKHDWWEEKLTGIPAKLHYRINHKALSAAMLSHCNKIAEIPQTEESKESPQFVGIQQTSLTDSSNTVCGNAANIPETTQRLPETTFENYLKADNSLERVSLFPSKTEPIVDEKSEMVTPVSLPQITESEAVIQEYPPTPHAQVTGTGVGTVPHVGVVAAHTGTDTGDTFQLQAGFGAVKSASENGKARTGKQPKNALTTSAGSTSGIPQTDHARLMAAQVEITGQPILNGGALGKAIKTILGAYTVDQAIECLRWMAEPSTNWKGSVNWLAVQNYIGEYFRRQQQQQQLKTNGGLNDKDVRGNLSRTKAETKADRSWITRQKWFRERFGDDAKVA